MDFTRWRSKHGASRDSAAACDSCLEAQVNACQQVTVFCPDCSTKKSVDINVFWEHERDGQRFRRVRCEDNDCKKHIRVNGWLRRPFEVDNTIKAWLRHNAVLHDDKRPPTMTVELYRSQIVSEDRRCTGFTEALSCRYCCRSGTNASFRTTGTANAH